MQLKWFNLKWFNMAQAISRTTHTLDAAELILGRLASRAATLLMGKHKPSFVPNADVGDIVHVEHAAKVRLSGRKSEQKVYKHYTGYQGGLKTVPFGRLQAQKPEEIVRKAILNMLPHNRLRAARMKRLKITA